MSHSVRDTGRSAVYAAERQVQRILDRGPDFPVVTVAGSTITLPVERHFGDLDSIQRYVDVVLAHPGVLAAWPDRAAISVRVRRRKGSRKAHYEHAGAVLAIPDGRDGRWAMREMLVTHELAHHFASASGHGAAFRNTVIDLAGITIGPEVGLLLRVAYHDMGL